MVWILSEVPVEKTKFFICACLSLGDSFWTWKGFRSISSLSIGSSAGLGLCRPCACCQSLWVHRCVSPVVSRRHCLLVIFHHHWLLPSFCLLFSKVSWCLLSRKGFDGNIPVRAECSKVSHSLYIVQSWVMTDMYLFLLISGGSPSVMGEQGADLSPHVHSRLSPTFSSIWFSVSGLKMRSLIHLELRFAHGGKYGPNWILLQADTQFVHLWKMASLFKIVFWASWQKKSGVHWCVDLCLGLHFYLIDQHV